MVGILFRLSIDPCVSSVPFAATQGYSYFKMDKEILFSMHTIFRTGQITKIDNTNPLYQVDLQLTSDDDHQLRILTEHIREELSYATGWQRIGKLLLKIGQFDKAEEFYEALLDKTSSKSEKALYYNQLGNIKNSQGDYEKTIWYDEKAVEIKQKTFPLNHPDLATSYNDIGLVYNNMGKYPKGLSFYEKALQIQQTALPSNHPSLATSYNNIGSVYNSIKEYSKALSLHEKAFEIQEKVLPPNHPDFGQWYNNIGTMYDDMEDYSKALSFYERALDIWQRVLPATHSKIKTAQKNIEIVKDKL